MDKLAPQGPIYQAGTLSGNPVCISAGIATLEKLKSLNSYNQLEKMTKKLCEQISRVLNEADIPHTINRIGSMFTLFFNPGLVTDYESAKKSDTARYAKFFRRMLKAGIYLPPSQFEACFLSTKHTQKDIDKTINSVRKLAKNI